MTEDDQNPETEVDGAVLSPEELDISDEENVVELEEGRYVISPGSDKPNVSSNPEKNIRPNVDPDEIQANPRQLTEEVVHQWIEARCGEADSKYAFDITASFEGRVSQKSLFSNDVVTTFENLVVWYAQHAGGDTPVEDVLGILLAESNLSIRFPSDALLAFAEMHGLDREDSIESLMEAAQEAGGIKFSGGDR